MALEATKCPTLVRSMPENFQAEYRRFLQTLFDEVFGFVNDISQQLTPRESEMRLRQTAKARSKHKMKLPF
jgi:hypothetical protein